MQVDEQTNLPFKFLGCVAQHFWSNVYFTSGIEPHVSFFVLCVIDCLADQQCVAHELCAQGAQTHRVPEGRTLQVLCTVFGHQACVCRTQLSAVVH